MKTKNMIKSQEAPIKEPLLAKTRHNEAGEIVAGCDVRTHLLATYYVAKYLIERLKMRGKVCFSSADLSAPLLHDIGKITPAFQAKLHHAIGDGAADYSDALVNKENHAVASYFSIKKFREDGEYLAEILRGHHGNENPKSEFNVMWYGERLWEAKRHEVAAELLHTTGTPLLTEKGQNPEAHQRLVLGLTVLADWISSGMELEDKCIPNADKIKAEIAQKGFIPFEIKPGLSFQAIFGFEPYAYQAKIVEQITPGSVSIIEMEMGGGKTETALYAAYKMLAEYEHTGIYFALPTQLTSEKIYDRFEKSFLRQILAEDSAHRKPRLLHGRALLSYDLQEGSSETGDKNPDSWFDDKKRGLLAPFAVGTVDQLLMSLINVKHRSLRAFGLVGKVIIMDEIHSYDAYTGTLIRNLVPLLLKWNCTVIILSATLTHSACASFLSPKGNIAPNPAYPRLSLRSESGEITQLPLACGEKKQVALVCTENEAEALEAAFTRFARGERVLWIENTVGEAQAVYREIVRRNNGDRSHIGLIHSRFRAAERSAKEKKWVDLYGKNRPENTCGAGYFLIGTQVLEQSLDIDADFLVTALCPSDFLLQRLGRLWRHAKLNPMRPKSARCEALILIRMLYENVPDKKYTEKQRPYADYVMMRTAEIVRSLHIISLPQDIRPILEQTYSERNETGYYNSMKTEMNRSKDKLEQFAKLAQGNANHTQPDDIAGAKTRYSDYSQIELLLIEDYYKEEGKEMLTVYGMESPVDLAYIKKCIKECPKEVRPGRLSRRLLKHTVKIAENYAPDYARFPLDFLKEYLYLGNEDYRPFRAAKYDAKTGRLFDIAGNVLENCRYDDLIGFEWNPSTQGKNA